LSGIWQRVKSGHALFGQRTEWLRGGSESETRKGGSVVEPTGFFGALFDFSFKSLVTERLIKVLYGLAILGAGLLSLSMAVTAFRGSTLVGLGMLILVAPLVFLLAVLYARVALEIIIVVFRMSDLLEEIALQGRKGA